MSSSSILKTSLLLIIALLILPIVFYKFDSQYPLNSAQQDTLKLLFQIMLAIALVCFIVGEATQNNSQVDKLWSIVPLIYVWIVAYKSGFDARVLLMAVLVTLWGARLTYNFSRRGAYQWKFWQGEEDYRWAILRQTGALQNPWTWRFFHLGFICLYQMTLILLFTLPILVAWQGSGKPLNWADVALTALFLVVLIVETVADQQQWNFHNSSLKKEKGFLDTGLWAKVRHPNYAAEQSIWVVFYFFSVAATGRWLNASAMGVILLLLLFQGSADFSEKISASKYPKYADYIKNVPRFLPKFW